MRLNLFWALPLASEAVLARPSPNTPGDWFWEDTVTASEKSCFSDTETFYHGFCSDTPQGGRVLMTTKWCNGGKCSVPSPPCMTDGGSDGTCMAPGDSCYSIPDRKLQLGKPGNVYDGGCLGGLICCHGQVRTKLSIGDDIITDEFFASEEPPPFGLEYLSFETNSPPSPEYESLSLLEPESLLSESESLPFEFVQAIESYNEPIPSDDMFLSKDSEDFSSFQYSFLPSSDSYYQASIPTDDTHLI